MAKSPSHKFGQIIGNLLEELIKPEFLKFCKDRNLYLDTQVERSPARTGKKVSWKDKYGNSHDLDFVIEKGGSKDKIGKPVAFIEAAWRRYTKHSRNKAQEIQGAVLPIADKHVWDAPFLGAVLAGVFTEGSLSQMKSTGFEILYIPYKSIVLAFDSVGIDVCFDESTPDSTFKSAISSIQALDDNEWDGLKNTLQQSAQGNIQKFLNALVEKLERLISQVVVLPLHGNEVFFSDASSAIDFVNQYYEVSGEGAFRKYEVIVRYTNGDSIDASFQDKDSVLNFLAYVSEQ